METIKVTINNITYDLLLAKTEEEKEKGLMDVESMEQNEGMYFCYKDDPQTELSFWMKDTSIPLDVVFISEDEVIEVLHGTPESEEYLTCTTTKNKPITAVVEVNSGSGIMKGDDVEYENEDSDLEPNKMYVLNQDGTAQFELKGGERIFSRKSSRTIIRKAKKAYDSKSDSDYKSLGRYIFRELDAQTERDPEYVKSRE